MGILTKEQYIAENDILVQITGQRISPTDWDRILSVCDSCGAVVVDQALHGMFHEREAR